VEECEKTLAGDTREPIADRLKKMLDKFGEFGVTKDMIEARQGYSFESFTEKDILSLIKVYNSINDGMGKREDYFEVAKPRGEDSDLAAEFKEAVKGEANGDKQSQLL